MILRQIDVLIFSLIILIFLLYDTKKSHMKLHKHSNYYTYIVISTMALVTLEIFTWLFDGQPGNFFHYAVYITNSLFYLVNLIPLSLWFIYLDECILYSEFEKAFKKVFYLGMYMISSALVIINPFTGILFTVDSDNMYKRGIGVLIVMALNYIMYFGFTISIIKHHKYISGRIYRLIIILGVLPAIGAVFQIAIYGLTLIWPMMTLVNLAGYMLIEREEIKRDSLTGLFTRTQLESRMIYKLSKKQAFSILMVDLDKFKIINDTFGHKEGDEALKVVANILSKSIKHMDTAFRYAGDEFIVLIETSDKLAPELVKERLINNLSKYNEAQEKPYTISFSIGIKYYDGISSETIHSIISDADIHMYRNKGL